MSEQAIETDDLENGVTFVEDDEVQVEEEVVEIAAESDEVEIVVEGEDEPTSETVPLGKFLKRVNKLNGRVSEANTEAEAEKSRREMVEQENDLLRLRLQQDEPVKRPKPADFESDAEYDTALDAYDEQRLDALANKKLAAHLETTQAQTQQQTIDTNLESGLKAHFERAEQLKVKDYETVEDKAIEVLGNDAAKFIMTNTVNSELIMFHLGKNPAKAAALAQKVKTNPVGFAVEIGGLSTSLKARPKHSNAPDPDALIKSGTSAGKGEAAGVTFS